MLPSARTRTVARWPSWPCSVRCCSLVAPAGSAGAAAASGRVRGGIYGAHGTTPKVVMQWFTKDWTYLGKRKQSNGVATR